MKFKKEKGIPMPTSRSGNKYLELGIAFSQLSVGDSIFIAFEPAVNDSAGKLRDRVYSSMAKAFPKQTIVRIVDGGVRIWKKADKNGQ